MTNEKKLEIILTELQSQEEVINNLKNGIKELRSQLIDGGYHESSVIILSIDDLIK